MVNLYKELRELYKEVSPKEFYRAIFPEGELDQKDAFTKGKFTGIACEITGEKSNKKAIVKRYSITDDLDTIDVLLNSENFVLLSPISYVGKSRKTGNAVKMYAFAIEVDSLRKDKDGKQIGFYDLVHHYTDIDLLPMPNYIVASGNGVHLYYVFEQPLILYDNVKKSLINFKKDITPKFWNRYVTTDFEKEKIQFESPFQGFRLVGGVTKSGERTHVFEVSKKPITPEHLNKYSYDEKNRIDTSYMSEYTLKEAKEQFPEWYERRIVKKESKGSWVCKRDLYDWWKRRIKKAEIGHRYYCLFCLSVYAIKCDIDEDELIQDLYSYLEPYDEMSNAEHNRFTESDVMDALQAFYDKGLVTYPVGSIAYKSGLSIKRNKRNGRKQEVHIKYMNNQRTFKVEMGECTNGGRPDKQRIVRKWQLEHPDGTKYQCTKETGLSKNTVKKWWNGEPEPKQNTSALDVPTGHFVPQNIIKTKSDSDTVDVVIQLPKSTLEKINNMSLKELETMMEIQEDENIIGYAYYRIMMLKKQKK